MNGVNIQPIDSWYNGQQVQINYFSLQIVKDNLSDFAQLEYFMINLNPSDPTNILYNVVYRANLTITGDSYNDWNNDPDANTWIYNWALNQLNLTQVP